MTSTPTIVSSHTASIDIGRLATHKLVKSLEADLAAAALQVLPENSMDFSDVS